MLLNNIIKKGRKERGQIDGNNADFTLQSSYLPQERANQVAILTNNDFNHSPLSFRQSERNIFGHILSF